MLSPPPTQPSRASRFPNLRDRGSCRGTVVINNKVHVFESHLELVGYWMLSARPDVADIWDQPPAIGYTDDDGVARRHTFDALVMMTTGLRVLIEFKPAVKVASSGIERVIELVAAQHGTRVADRIVVITDKNFTRNDKFNARLQHDCGKHAVAAHDEAVVAAVAGLIGSVTIGDLADSLGFGGIGFRAVVRAISRGLLVRDVRSARITRDALVSRAPAT